MMSTKSACPICGKLAVGVGMRHRCPASTLRHIDAANQRAINAEDAELDCTSAGTPHPNYSQRLADGMAIIHTGEDIGRCKIPNS